MSDFSNFLTESERSELERLSRCQKIDAVVWKRARVLLLVDGGHNLEIISTILDIAILTIKETISRFREHSLCSLDRKKYRQREGHLNRHQEKLLVAHLRAHPAKDTAEIIALIERIFGVLYSKPGLIKALHRLDFSYRKPEKITKPVSREEQQAFIDFYDNLLNNIGNNELVYFSDAVHPQYQTRPAHGWFHQNDKPVVQTTSGRKRMNIQAALCLETFDTPFVEVETVNAQSTIRLLEKLEARHQSATCIHLFVDNAKYHKAKVVCKWLERKKCRIKLHFVPAYCPHLNPIERLWGLLHKRVTHNRYHPSFNHFCDAVLKFLRQTIPKKWKSFRDYITDNFHIESNDGQMLIG